MMAHHSPPPIFNQTAEPLIRLTLKTLSGVYTRADTQADTQADTP